jgi:hypothetical protein
MERETMSLINSREQIKIVNDFSGLRFGSISPTDIDGMIDFQNKAFTGTGRHVAMFILDPDSEPRP